MKRTIGLVVVALLLAACGGSTSADSSATPSVTASSAASQGPPSSPEASPIPSSSGERTPDEVFAIVTKLKGAELATAIKQAHALCARIADAVAAGKGVGDALLVWLTQDMNMVILDANSPDRTRLANIAVGGAGSYCRDYVQDVAFTLSQM